MKNTLNLNKVSNLHLTKGFTLIELLVVIAIIGILSGIVLTSLNAARSKAADTKVKAQMASMRSQAEMYYDGLQSFTNVCTNTNGLVKLLVAVPGAVCSSDAVSWAVQAPLTSGNYCVDYTGVATSSTKTGNKCN